MKAFLRSQVEWIMQFHASQQANVMEVRFISPSRPISLPSYFFISSDRGGNRRAFTLWRGSETMQSSHAPLPSRVPIQEAPVERTKKDPQRVWNTHVLSHNTMIV